MALVDRREHIRQADGEDEHAHHLQHREQAEQPVVGVECGCEPGVVDPRPDDGEHREREAGGRLADVRFGDAVREFVACDAEGGDEGEVEEQFERRRAAVRVAEIAPRHALEPVTVIAGCGHLGSAPSLVDI